MDTSPSQWFSATLSSEELCLAARQWSRFVLSSVCLYVIAISFAFVWQLCKFYLKRRRNEPNNIVPDDSKSKNHDEGVETVELDEPRVNVKKQWALTSKRTASIFEVVAFVLSMGSFIIYCFDASNEYVETCQSSNGMQQIDLAFSIFFLLYFFLRLIAATDKLRFMFEIYSFVDFFTIPSPLLSLYLGRTWLGLRSLRVLYILSIPNILHFFNLSRTPRFRKQLKMICGLLAFVLASAGIVHLLENSGDPPDFANPQKLSYITCVYFLLISMTTVGYGDVFCITILGRIFICCFLIIGPIMFLRLIVEFYFSSIKEGRSANGEFINTLCETGTDGDEDSISRSRSTKKSNSTLQASSVQEDVVTNAISYFVVTNSLPSTIIEHEKFKELLQTLIPGFKLTSRTILAAKTIPSLRIKFNEIIKSQLRSVKHISATLNECRLSDGNSEISFIVTFVTSKWELESRELFSNERRENNLEMIKEMLEEFEIPRENVSSITTEINSIFAETAKHLGIQHIPCFDNLLNNLIQEIFSIQNVKDLTVKTLNLYNAMNTEKYSENVENIQNNSPLQSKWNMLRQLEFIKSNKNSLDKLLTTNEHLLLTADEHNITEYLIELLRPLEEYNKALKDRTSPTGSLILAVANKLQNITQVLGDKETPFLEIVNYLRKFAAQLSSTYSQMHHLDIAQYFDPRVAVNNEKLNSILAALKVDYQELKKSKCGLEMLFEDRQEPDDIADSKLYNEFILFNSRPQISFDENPLNWWKNSAATYPILSKICKKYLSMQATCGF